MQPRRSMSISPMATAVTELTMRHENLWDDESKALQAWWRDNPERFRCDSSPTWKNQALNQVPRKRGGRHRQAACAMPVASTPPQVQSLPAGMCNCHRWFSGRWYARSAPGRRRKAGQAVWRASGGEGKHSYHRWPFGTCPTEAALMSWLRHFSSPPKVTFVVHGEQSSARTFAELIEHDLQWNNVTMPAAGECIALDAALMRLEQGTQES